MRRTWSYCLGLLVLFNACDFIRMKGDQNGDETRKAVARVGDTFLYADELRGIASSEKSREDSTARVSAYV
ncbi:MAG: hypothetical protein ACKOE6_13950, partial [Flammeovirgaceae bacterium]